MLADVFVAVAVELDDDDAADTMHWQAVCNEAADRLEKGDSVRVLLYMLAMDMLKCFPICHTSPRKICRSREGRWYRP